MPEQITWTPSDGEAGWEQVRKAMGSTGAPHVRVEYQSVLLNPLRPQAALLEGCPGTIPMSALASPGGRPWDAIRQVTVTQGACGSCMEAGHGPG